MMARRWLACGAAVLFIAAACSGEDQVFGDPNTTSGAGAEGGESSAGGDTSAPATSTTTSGSGGMTGTGGSTTTTTGAGGAPMTCGAITCTGNQACCNNTYCYPAACSVCCPGGSGGSMGVTSTTVGSGTGGSTGVPCGTMTCQPTWYCCSAAGFDYCTPSMCP